jgi:hypothetical protein
MVSSVGTPLGQMAPVFTDEQVASLARTYGRVRHPVWVSDFADRCVYRNAPAAQMNRPADTALVFDIEDHNGRVVGTLATVVN